MKKERTHFYRFYRQVSPTLEHGYHIETSVPLTRPDTIKLLGTISERHQIGTMSPDPILNGNTVEIGPRLEIETPDSSNAVAICHAIGLHQVRRVERTNRYLAGNGQEAEHLLKTRLDQMTQQHYPHGIESFDTGITPKPVQVIDLIAGGMQLLQQINKTMGLSMDEADREYYYDLFVRTLLRNPTDVELLQLGNANSEHSRHWFFGGKIIIDGNEVPHTLFQIVKSTLGRLANKHHQLVAFNDNSGVVTGSGTSILMPEKPGMPSEMKYLGQTVHYTHTAETHNHPTSVAPYPGAATGTGGRIRDTCAVGRGGYIGVGGIVYCVGSLFIPGYQIPGEVVGKDKPSKYASSLQILLQASRATADYGNPIGEPTIFGSCRTWGQVVDEEWIEWRKPILYSCGSGHIFDTHTKKETPEIGMIIVAIGGPAYRIGVGGGAASSMQQGENSEDLDFASVQRGDPQMENRVNRVIRTCIERGIENPISSIHDQGAGGPSNVLTELLEPLGGKIDLRQIVLGDQTMSALEIWSAEFQERYGLLIRPAHIDAFKAICARERVNCEIVGEIDGSKKVTVFDSKEDATIVDLNLDQILTALPQKTFTMERRERKLTPLSLPKLTLRQAIEAVFKLPSVGSKGHLVHQHDRSVTGLVVQQQCCGLAQIPIADAGVSAQSYMCLTGSAQSLGEQPIKMLINPQAGARLSVAEMLSNMASVCISDLYKIGIRANSMWPAKKPFEGPRFYDAIVAMAEFMIDVGVGINGGKDSLSMVAKVGTEEVKAPGSLVIYGNAPVRDITKRVTPDIKQPGTSLLALIDLGLGMNRLGGSALAQSCNQLGDESPDIDPILFKKTFLLIQRLIAEGLILSLHDRSDGGLITTVAEMCMASGCGFHISIPDAEKALESLFAEECGFVLELDKESVKRVYELCEEHGVPIQPLGITHSGPACVIKAEKAVLFSSTTQELRCWWEATSTELEKLHRNPACAEEEYMGLTHRLPPIEEAPAYKLSFTPTYRTPAFVGSFRETRVAVLREEGTNGEREMSAALIAGGLQPWDVAMSDLRSGTITLDSFQMLAFPGGFSFMDVFGSAKGWAAGILFNDRIRDMFERFRERTDTLTFGVCNGCQEMPFLELVPWQGIADEKQPRFLENFSRRFESRWSTVEILESPAVMLSGMAGSKLGVWVAHGEGRLFFPDQEIAKEVIERRLAPLRFTDQYGAQTERYPFNPNGSPYGIAGLCSPDGRHLAIMPHPERCFLPWQQPWMPSAWKKHEAAPWLKMFQNARQWCMDHKA